MATSAGYACRTCRAGCAGTLRSLDTLDTLDTGGRRSTEHRDRTPSGGEFAWACLAFAWD